jgi:hypothetical protein
MSYSKVLIDYMRHDEKMKDCNFLHELEKNEKLRKWVDEHKDYQIINVLPHKDSSEVLGFILKNCGTKQGLYLISQLEKSPESLEELMLFGSSDKLAKKYHQKSAILEKSISSQIDDISIINNQLNFFMTETEYENNFHKLFSKVSNITKEEGEELIRKWVSVTRGFSNRVGILNEDEELIFVHPGLASPVDTTGINNTWMTFTNQSKAREGKAKGVKEHFQDLYLEKYVESLDGVKDKKGKALIDFITTYYDCRIAGLIMPKKEEMVEVKTKETNEWSSDLFE